MGLSGFSWSGTSEEFMLEREVARRWGTGIRELLSSFDQTLDSSGIGTSGNNDDLDGQEFQNLRAISASGGGGRSAVMA